MTVPSSSTLPDPLPSSPDPADGKARATGRGDRWRALVPFAVLVVLYAITVAVAPGYLAGSQIGSLLQLAALLGIVAIGQTLVILVGGIDLSVSAVITLTNLLSAGALAGSDANLPKAIGIALGLGLLWGLVNGIGVVLLKVPDMVMTLATFTIVTGVAYILTGGAPKGASSPALMFLVQHRFAGFLTLGVVFWVLLGALVVLGLRYTVMGQDIYATGLNRRAAYASGVRVGPMIVGLYTVSGVCAGVVGLLLTGYTGSSYFGSGDAYQLASIAAVVLGGTSIYGGSGGYIGTVAGAAITTLLLSLLQVVGIPTAGQNIAYGAVIIAMLIVFSRGRRPD